MGGPFSMQERITQLEAENDALRSNSNRAKNYDDQFSKLMPEDFKDWWQNDKSEWPVVAARLLADSRNDASRVWEMQARTMEERDTLRDELSAIRVEASEMIVRETMLRNALARLVDCANVHLERNDEITAERLDREAIKARKILQPGWEPAKQALGSREGE